MSGGDTILEHATAVSVDRRGVLIHGPSGSGKTALAIEILSRCRASGIESALVADDYVFLAPDAATGALVATVPDRIAGLIELRGFGIVSVGPDRHLPSATLALSVRLIEPEDADRVADPDRRATYRGVDLPELALPRGMPASAALAVLGWLGLSGRVL